MKQLWEDQSKIVNELSELIDKGKNNIVIFSTTGSGKTTIAAFSIINLFPTNNHLFLVNRDALILNTYEEFQEFNHPCSIFAANYPTYFDATQRIQIASIQTISARGMNFLQHLPNQDKELFIWFDEAHLTSFTQVAVSLFRRPNTKRIGLTGTPERTSPDEELGDKFDHLIKGAMPWELIAQGRLKQPIYYNLESPYDLKSDDVIAFLIKEWKRLARGRKTILFAADVSHAHRISEAFNKAGIPFAPIDATIPVNVRQDRFNALKNGQLIGLASFDALSEGFNVKPCSCVMTLRKTESRSKYYQQLGRGLRFSPGINDCLVLDFVGLSSDDSFGCIEDIIDVNLFTSDSAFEVHRAVPKKVCPSCSALVPVFHLTCSQCGYKFPKKALPPLSPEAELIKHLSLRERGMILSYRKQLQKAYMSESSFSTVEKEFISKFDHEPLPEWTKGAIFSGNSTVRDKAKFLQYLQKVAAHESKTQLWVQEQFRNEFFDLSPER